MGITGDHFEGQFEEHKIEIVRTNLDKVTVVLVDGYEVVHESVALPHNWDKDKEFQIGSCGKKHTLHAHSQLKKIFGFLPVDNEYTVVIDGQEVLFKRIK
jgi:hypothetical protein